MESTLSVFRRLYRLFQGVVSGTLLVTPNAIMFDPNVSDTLVIGHGADLYGTFKKAPGLECLNCSSFVAVDFLLLHFFSVGKENNELKRKGEKKLTNRKIGKRINAELCCCVFVGMIAPMETVISAALYHDIAAMKLKGQKK